MNGIAKLAAGAAVAAVVGTGAALASRPMYEKLGESYVGNQYEDLDERYAALKPGDRWIPNADSDEGDGYASVMIPVLSVFGAGGSLIGASSLMSRGSMVPGLGLAALAGGLVGGAVGYVMGASKGASEVHARYGADIDKVAPSLVATYDTSKNGTLELDPAGRLAGEYLQQSSGKDMYSGQTVTYYTSVEHAVRAADASGDGVVTTAEVKALLTSFDANHDGLLQPTERQAFTDAGHEHHALYEVKR